MRLCGRLKVDLLTRDGAGQMTEAVGAGRGEAEVGERFGLCGCDGVGRGREASEARKRRREWLAEVLGELRSRFGTSGLTEKASRSVKPQ